MSAIKLFTKPETERLWNELLASKQPFYTWTRHSKVPPQKFILSMLKHFRETWEVRPQRFAELKQNKCGWCDDMFYANVASQQFCDKACQRNHWQAKYSKDGKTFAEAKAQQRADRIARLKSGDAQTSEG